MRASRRSVVVIVAGGALTTALGLACAPFGAASTADDDEDGSASDASVAADGPPPTLIDGATPPDGSGVDASLGPGTCFDFTTGTHGMTETNATATADGYVLSIRAGQFSSIRKTFTTAQNVSLGKSTVRVLASAAIEGKWGPETYVDVMAQYLGDAPSYTAAPAMSLELLQSRLELNVWHAANTFDGTYMIETPALAAGGPARWLAIESSWAQGKTDVVLDGTTFPFATKKTTSQSTELTLVIGGTVHDGPMPGVLLTVKALCVELR